MQIHAGTVSSNTVYVKVRRSAEQSSSYDPQPQSANYAPCPTFIEQTAPGPLSKVLTATSGVGSKVV
jgi:hypothetical protein